MEQITVSITLNVPDGKATKYRDDICNSWAYDAYNAQLIRDGKPEISKVDYIKLKTVQYWKSVIKAENVNKAGMDAGNVVEAEVS